MLATSTSSATPAATAGVTPPATAALELRDLACVRGRRRLFRGLNAALTPGQLLRVTGANGAGKTSLLRMLCGLLAPAHGQVLWQGQDLKRVRDSFHRQLIYLGHAAALKDDLTPLENLRVAARLGGDAPDETAARQALVAAGLGGREHVPARTLSQGQRRRAALARLPLGSARLWVLDEPFNALDTAATGWLLGLIESHLQRAGMVVLTSHQPVGLSEHCQQCSLAL